MLQTIWPDYRQRLIALVRLALIVAGAYVIGRLIVVASQNDLPVLHERSLVFVFMLVPILLAVILLLARAEVGFGLVVFAATLAISKTGFQIDIGPVRTSALEVLIVFSAPVLLLRSRLFTNAPRWPSLPLDHPLLLFALLSVPALVVAFSRQVSWSNVLWEYKGYFLYPLLVYVMVAWIRTERRWFAVALVGLLGATVVAATGLASFRPQDIQALAGSALAANEARTGGIFGVINQYGYYLASMALFALGVISAPRNLLISLGGIGFVGFMILAMALAGSRSAWLGLAIGSLVFMVFSGAKWNIRAVFLILVAAIFSWQLQYYGSRLLTLEDSSAGTRFVFADLGWLVFQQYPIFGAGWGASFNFDLENNIVPINLIPWLHNDYLNLLTQVGLVGMIPFVWLGIVLFRRTFSSLPALDSPRLRAPIVGAFAGLISILFGATAEQVFARPDIAGHVWWMVGMVLAGIALARKRDA